MRKHLQQLRATLPPDLAAPLLRYGCAPFASDPALTLTQQRGPDTPLPRWPLYVCSLKPYAVPGRTYPNGWDQRADHPGYHRWYDSPSATGNFVREADQLLRHTLTATGCPNADPRLTFNTYAYPWRAEDSAQLKSYGLNRISIVDLHRQWLDIVQPRIILCIGNGPAPSAFATMCEAVGLSPKHATVLTPAPRLKVRHLTTVDSVLVLGVPHLSRVRAADVRPAVERVLKQHTHR